MDKKYIICYKWALNENDLFSSEMQEIEFYYGYTFTDFLQDRNVSFDRMENTFYVLDDFKEKTGEVYTVYYAVDENGEKMQVEKFL